VFRLIDQSSFCCLLQYCYPSLADSDIPHHTKLQEQIMRRAKQVEEQIKEHLSVHHSYMILLDFVLIQSYRKFLVRYHSLLTPGPPTLASLSCLSLGTTLMPHLKHHSSGSFIATNSPSHLSKATTQEQT
jgi:hypothetical protein